MKLRIGQFSFSTSETSPQRFKQVRLLNVSVAIFWWRLSMVHGLQLPILCETKMKRRYDRVVNVLSANIWYFSVTMLKSVFCCCCCCCCCCWFFYSNTNTRCFALSFAKFYTKNISIYVFTKPLVTGILLSISPIFVLGTVLFTKTNNVSLFVLKVSNFFPEIMFICVVLVCPN